MILCTSVLHSVDVNEACTMDMYGNDSAAYWACKIQFAHQANFFPSPIAGLFSYQVWNGYDGFWQNGIVIETLTNFIHYTNNTHTRYMTPIRNSDRDLYSLLEAYGPQPSFDDMAWYGLAYTKVHEVITGTDKFFKDAIDVYNWVWKNGWDTYGACGGGFWFDDTLVSKQTITNAQMMMLSAQMYRLTKQKHYLQKMNKIYMFILNNSLINETTYLVSDGANANCTPQDIYGPTYNSGVMVGALAEMYKVTHNTLMLDLAFKVVVGKIEHSSDADGIFYEYCEPNCDEDALMYKGLFVRNVRYLMDVLDDPVRRDYLQNWLELQINANLKYNLCDLDPITKCNISYRDGPPYFNKTGPVFSPDWRGPFSYGAPMQQSSVLDLFIAAIKPGTTCTGKYCNYDPRYPDPQELTCKDYPCPSDQDCCEYSPYTSYTCCEPSQHCNKTTGVCDG
ncbi:hypothetical protein ACF0H5_010873 [Mactra antiquata]